MRSEQIEKSEAEIQAEIVEYLKLCGWLVFRLNSGKAANNLRLCPPGTPDLLAVGRLASFWIEVKTPTGKLRPEQEQMIEELRKRGQFVLVARSVEDVVHIGVVDSAQTP
jgi:hypothetical protein